MAASSRNTVPLVGPDAPSVDVYADADADADSAPDTIPNANRGDRGTLPVPPPEDAAADATSLPEPPTSRRRSP